MNKMRKKPHTPAFKFKVALEAIRGEKTTAQMCQEFGVVASQIAKWKKTLVDEGCAVFTGKRSSQTQDQPDIDKLHATIGRLKVENDFLEHVLGKSR